MIYTGAFVFRTTKRFLAFLISALFVLLAALGLGASSASADSASDSVNINLSIGAAISVRVLDSTATDEISYLTFDLTPTASGVTSTKRAVVDVSTTNITGYKLYVEANGKDHSNNYTTDLVQGDQDDSHVIPTSTSTVINKNFWNYVNPSLGTTSVIPAHGTPDKIAQAFTPADSDQSNVDINVGVDTTITAGSYSNQLLFTAIANADSIDYTLAFNKNAPAGVDPSTIENFPVSQTASSTATSYTFTIPDTAPSLVGYTFGGYVDPTVPTGKGSAADPYLPGDDVVVVADTSTSSASMSGLTTLNARWGIMSATLTINPNGGAYDGSASEQTFTQEYGTTKHIDLPSSNATYTISYDANGQGADYTGTPTSVTRNFTEWTLEATRAAGPGTWDSTTSTYTFGTTGGTLTATYNETSNTFTLPAISKTGYDCKWAEGSASGTQYAGGTERTLSANTTYYAVCGVKSYTLTINPNGGAYGGSSEVQTFDQNYGTTKSISDPSSNATYTISYDANGQGADYTGTPTSVARPFTSYTLTATPSGTAHGTMNDGTYTYGAGNDTLTANYNTTSSSFTLPGISKTGYACKWAEGSASGTQYDGGTSRTITGNTTYFAVCTIRSYDLTIKPNGGKWDNKTTDSTITQNYNTRYPASGTLPDATNGPTYTIDYNMGDTGITKPSSPTSIDRPFTSWTKDGTGTWDATNKYWTFGAGNGSLTANWSETSNTFTLPALSKTGHTCKWHLGSASGTEYNPSQANVTITGNSTFYATCSINSYTLTINPNGGKWNNTTSNTDVTQNYNTRYPTSGALANATNGPTYTISYDMGSTGITKPTSPASVSKAFSSWTKGGTGTWNSTDKYWTFGAGNGTLTASWSSTSETFTLPALSKTGHTCKWHAGSTTGTEYNGGATGVTISGNTTFYATCSINSYELTVSVPNGTWSAPSGFVNNKKSQNYNTTVTIPNPVSSTNYTISYNMGSTGITTPTSPTSTRKSFKSWTVGGAGSISGTTYTYGAGAGTLTATWNDTSETFTLPALSKTGHTCKWHAGSTTGTEYNGGATGVTITGNTTFYATCSVNSYNVTVNKGTNIASVSGGGSKNYGSTVTLGATGSAGYHLSGWTVNSGGVTISNNQFTMPANDVVVTANAAINTCSIKYNSNAPSGTTASGTTANSSFNYNTVTATTANGFSVTGYQWSGWAESETGAAVVTTSGGSITAAQATSWCGTHGTTKDLYAKWTKKYTYTLNLNTNDSTTNKQILNYPTSGGTTATSHTFTNLNSYAPTRAGYVFKGWSTSSTGTSYVTSRTLNSSSASSTPTTNGFPVTGNLYAIWERNCANGANRICFIANAPSGTVSGTMEDQTIVYMTSSTAAGSVDSTALSSSTTELTLYSPNWTLSGYGFKGWNTAADGSGTWYGPNQTITLTSDQKAALGAGGIRLYAQWVASAGNMASWSGCSSLAQGSVTALTYGSDTYAIAKLADGKCWMIENLRTSTNAGTDKGTSWTTTYTDRQYNLANVTGSSPSATTSGSTAIQWKSYGGYYSWHSAINTPTEGSTQYYNWNTSSNSYTTTGTTQGICPSGWRLPRSYAGDGTTNNANSDFRNLNNILNSSWSSVSTAAASNNWRKYPNNFVFAGYWYGSSSDYRGTRGFYWSSTVYYSNYAYNLYFNSTSVNPAYFYNKSYGYSVRCVASS